MINCLSRTAAFESLEAQLGIPLSKTPDNKVTWFAHFMRHACALYCPIPRGKLIRITFDLLFDIIEDATYLHDDIEHAINGLFESGDLLEIPRFDSSDERYTGDWVFLAPPSYIQRASGRIYICGIAADDAFILPISLREDLKSVGPYRYLQDSDATTISLLQSIGLRSIPETLWRVNPKRQSSQEYVDHALRKLANAPPSGAMDGIRIFKKNEGGHIQYKTRWVRPQTESGFFVCRRPSGYGAENWSYVQLENGQAVRFIDLPWAGERLRGCDAGWRLQLAIDSVYGKPATYKMKQCDDKVVVRFSFPIPLWAQRRFQAVDDHLNESLFQRNFSLTEWPTEKSIIENDLWFVSE